MTSNSFCLLRCFCMNELSQGAPFHSLTIRATPPHRGMEGRGSWLNDGDAKEAPKNRNPAITILYINLVSTNGIHIHYYFHPGGVDQYTLGRAKVAIHSEIAQNGPI